MFNQRKPNGFVRSARYIGVASRPSVGNVVTDAATHIVGIVGIEGLRRSGRGLAKTGRRVAHSPMAQDVKSAGRTINARGLASTVVSAVAIDLVGQGIRSGLRGSRVRYQASPGAQARAARRAARHRAA